MLVPAAALARSLNFGGQRSSQAAPSSLCAARRSSPDVFAYSWARLNLRRCARALVINGAQQEMMKCTMLLLVRLQYVTERLNVFGLCLQVRRVVELRTPTCSSIAAAHVRSCCLAACHHTVTTCCKVSAIRAQQRTEDDSVTSLKTKRKRVTPDVQQLRGR